MKSLWEEATPIQMGFLKKVYGIVGAQLLVSAIVTAIINQYESIREIAFTLLIPSCIVSIVIGIILLISKKTA